MVFSRHFLSLFTELNNRKISLAVFDLLLILGSGYKTGTLMTPEQESL